MPWKGETGLRKLTKFKPTRFMSKSSHYNKLVADRAVSFINCLKHTKGEWYGQPFELIDWQEQIIRDLFGVLKANDYRQFNTAYVEIPKKQGKELSLDTPIPTPNGWTTMGDIQIGDAVFNEKGQVCHVVAISDIDDTEQAYRITFKNGSSIVAGERHQWAGEYTHGKIKPRIMTTGELYGLQNKCAGCIRFRIPVSDALQTEVVDLPVHPYVYGYWLGNGNSVKPEITIRTCDVDSIISQVPYEIGKIRDNVGDSRVVVIPKLRELQLKTFRDKTIDPTYLRASVEQRLALLQGLMDSDGCVENRKGQGIYVSTIENLALSVSELLWSLGIKNNFTPSFSRRYGIPTGETLYTVRFTAFDDLCVSQLSRKQNNTVPRNIRTRSHFHYIDKIAPVGQTKMRCIQVDSPSHIYLAGRTMVPTHNSELAAAVALLLTCGDSEYGGEIYGCASDRQQASIVFDVAVQMVEQSPALKARIKPVLSQKRLVYKPLNSYYQVLSAEAFTKHGLNVHGVVFDELHTQPNRSLYDVMTHGSGDARNQPLYFLITTAGNDQNSICWEVHQKAVDILHGRKSDPSFYPVIYGAGENDDWTSEKVWARANPSLDITVDIDKLRIACESAKQNPAEENLFRQLRLCQWVKQSIRWMPMEKWDLCSFAVDPESLRGRICYGGLDLSSSTDLTAFVLVFPPVDEADKYQLLPYFWIPEDNISLRVKRDHVNYDVWAQQGFLLTTEGNVVHYGFIESFIEDLGTRFNIREIAFDRWGAVQMTQNLEGLGFTVVPFGQGYKDMSPPTRELMKLTLEQKLAHSGHPVLRWCMDNIFIRTDPAGNIKPDKEKSTEKIDGAVATIMALDRAIRNGNITSSSIYDDRGLLIL